MGHFTNRCDAEEAVRFQNPPAPIESELWRHWDEQLDANHIVRVIKDGVAGLDLGALRKSYSGRGSAPYPPELMLAMVLVEKHAGHCSPSEWHRHQSESIPMLWIGQGIRPARGVWYQFRDRIAPFLDLWISQILGEAVEANITSATRGVVDGTLIAASASRHRLFNEKQVTSRLRHLEESLDCDERKQPLKDSRQWMAKTPRGRTQQRARYLRAQEFLQRRLEANAHKIPSERASQDRVVVSVTDPEAALAPDKFKVFRPLYNSLFVTDRESSLILGYAVFAQSQDTPLLIPIIQRTKELTGRSLKEVTADSGFITGRNLARSEEQGVELIGPWKVNDFSKPAAKIFYDKDQFVWHAEDREYECPAHRRLKLLGTEKRRRADGYEEQLERFKANPADCAACPCRAACTNSKEGRQLRRSEYEDQIVAHRIKMETPAAKAMLKTRGQIVERSFADLKEHRALRCHTGRGLERVRIDTGLAVLIHNLLTLRKKVAPTGEERGASP